jgi:beta-phosphoglucomutase-like phosphatase (HAD superfamily)
MVETIHPGTSAPGPDAKRMLMERILRRPGIRPHHPIGFGDGPVEIEELKRAGALAVGLATNEPECRRTSPWRRRNLIEVGADYIIPNYLCRPVLLPMLFFNHEPI